MIFAELDLTSTGLLITAAVFITLGAIAHITNEILRFADRFKDKPPMDEQLRRHETRIMARLDEQDVDAQSRVALLRGHLDHEISKVHARIDAHGNELFRLKGFVEGKEARS